MKVGHPQPLVSICRVERGMYVLRYVEAAAYPHPRAEIAFDEGRLRIVDAPGRESAALSEPGQALVIVAQDPCEFEIRVLAVDGGGTDAQFGLDVLDAGRPRQDRAAERDAWRSPDAAARSGRPSFQGRDEAGLSILAHVSRRGDVRVGADTWIAGPNEVLPIEGLAIATGRPDLGIRIRVQTVRGGQQWSRWCEAEEFAGSRQKADALTGIGAALTGAAAVHFEISADVMALGAPSQTRTGQSVEFYGPDTIVGFRLRLNPVTVPSNQEIQSPVAPVRVFRARR